MPGLVRFSFFHAFAFALCVVSYGQAPAAATPSTNSTDQLPQKIVQMLNTQVVWDNGFNHPHGPRLRFAKLDEVTRKEGHFTRYRIYAAGVPEGQPYILAAWSIGA